MKVPKDLVFLGDKLGLLACMISLCFGIGLYFLAVYLCAKCKMWTKYFVSQMAIHKHCCPGKPLVERGQNTDWDDCFFRCVSSAAPQQMGDRV